MDVDTKIFSPSAVLARSLNVPVFEGNNIELSAGGVASLGAEVPSPSLHSPVVQESVMALETVTLASTDPCVCRIPNCLNCTKTERDKLYSV